MSKTFYENLLEKFKKANKGRKIKLATQAGFGSAESYKHFLENNILGETAMAGTPVSEEYYKKVIHIVDIIDCSASMNQPYGNPRITNAIKGINSGIEALKESKENIDYTYTICDFSDNFDINFMHVGTPIEKIKLVNFRSRNMTALNDAIGITLQKIQTLRTSEDKVLINIYTDGGENNSRQFNKSEINTLIQKLSEEGVTVTFIGTEKDTDSAVQNYGIDYSNTLSYDGSSEGLFKTMSATQSARATYSSKVSKGQDVKTGFYKNITKK